MCKPRGTCGSGRVLVRTGVLHACAHVCMGVFGECGATTGPRDPITKLFRGVLAGVSGAEKGPFRGPFMGGGAGRWVDACDDLGSWALRGLQGNAHRAFPFSEPLLGTDFYRVQPWARLLLHQWLPSCLPASMLGSGLDPSSAVLEFFGSPTSKPLGLASRAGEGGRSP